MVGPLEAVPLPFWLAGTEAPLYNGLPGILDRPVEDTVEKKEAGWIVTVFDNDINTYDEVIMILMAATGCSAQEAYIEAWEIDHLGQSVVHHSTEDECKIAASIIAEIGIRVEVGPA
jgi:ATP-dependent Clp protease adaptor protein ClpS